MYKYLHTHIYTYIYTYIYKYIYIYIYMYRTWTPPVFQRRTDWSSDAVTQNECLAFHRTLETSAVCPKGQQKERGYQRLTRRS